MIKFLIYLFESGMCLTLLFLVYYLFLRKETYFTFNRIYLLSILVLSLLLPIVHLNFTLPRSKTLENRVEEIRTLKSYYENIIALTDPDYANSFTKAFQQNNENEFDEANFIFSGQNPPPSNQLQEKNISKIKTGFWAEFNLSRILLSIYLLGVLFFAGRLILLFYWLNQSIEKYGATIENGIKMVKMDEEVPPFSFFRFVFINKETDSFSGFEQIVAHEKVHILQRHSIDLLLTHFITVFQWFNPFVWLINKAMKTNHEYIADRNVVEQGYELFDYQSLLLKQMISIRSVELVNNFNLINIKKRIAMMTKIKSGLAAQLKALVVIPAAMFLFFFFAEITFAQDAIGFQNKDLTKEIQGFWKNTDENSYGQLLNFKGEEIQILEKNDAFRNFTYDFQTSTVSMTKEFFETSKLKEYSKNINDWAVMMIHPESENSKIFYVSLKNDDLCIVWNSSQPSLYKRTAISNSLEPFFKDFTDDFTPVSANYFRTIENSDNTFRIIMNRKGEILLDGEHVNLENIEDKIKKIRSKDNPFNAPKKFAVIIVDARCEMAYVNVMYRKLREMDQLLHILSVKPLDPKVPEIFYHNVGIPRLLPPKDAKLLDEKEVKKSGMEIHRIDLTKGNISPESVSANLQKEIKKNQKYVILYIYDNKTTYKEYMTYLDEIYQVIFEKRNQLAQEKYKLNYDDLADLQQKEIRKTYPLTLTERNVDQVE